MSKVCQISGKKASVGNNVSHSKRRTKRRFNVNLHKKKFYWVEQDMWIELLVSAHALRRKVISTSKTSQSFPFNQNF